MTYVLTIRQSSSMCLRIRKTSIDPVNIDVADVLKTSMSSLLASMFLHLYPGQCCHISLF